MKVTLVTAEPFGLRFLQTPRSRTAGGGAARRAVRTGAGSTAPSGRCRQGRRLDSVAGRLQGAVHQLRAVLGAAGLQAHRDIHLTEVARSRSGNALTSSTFAPWFPDQAQQRGERAGPVRDPIRSST